MGQDLRRHLFYAYPGSPGWVYPVRVGLVLSALLQLDMQIIILVTGILVIIYTASGGMNAVIWTDVVQSVLLSFGAILIVFILIRHTPGGLGHIISSGISGHKFSLGSWKFSFTDSTVWVVFLYGFFINLTNFGIDQNYVQRYHAARSEKEASRSVRLLPRLYIPVSMLFFFIGTSLFVFAIDNSGFLKIMLQDIPGLPAAGNHISPGTLFKTLSYPGVGDKALPAFIAHEIPTGFSGLIVAALLAAAMSTISSSLNSMATVYLHDIHPANRNSNAGETRDLRILKIATVVSGLIGLLTAIGMIGVKSILDAWWILSGIFSGGLLGLFLLGWGTKVKNPQAFYAVITGVLIIIWMTFPGIIPPRLGFLRSPFHANMTIVIGTLSIFIGGLLFASFSKRKI